MKIIHSDLKHGEAKVKAENLDDLWYLSTLVEEGDLVQGQTIRKIKIGEQADQTPKIIKKTVFLKILVEKVEFSKYTNTLRVLGTIAEGSDDIPKGAHHAFVIEEGTIITIIKEHWLQYHLEKLKEASTTQAGKTLICVFDREEAYFALMKRYGYDILSRIRGSVEKKAEKVTGTKNFYEEINAHLLEYLRQHHLDHIILASPAFWKDEFLKSLKDEELKKRIVMATCSSCDTSAFNEVLQRKEVEQALKQDRIAKEVKLVEQLFTEIAKNNLAAYGINEVTEKAQMGAVSILLVTDNCIQKMREANEYKKIETIMRAVEQSRGEVHLVSSEHEGGRRLDGLGGVGAILRYKTY